jgi:hypothetical protein
MVIPKQMGMPVRISRERKNQFEIAKVAAFIEEVVRIIDECCDKPYSG